MMTPHEPTDTPLTREDSTTEPTGNRMSPIQSDLYAYERSFPISGEPLPPDQVIRDAVKLLELPWGAVQIMYWLRTHGPQSIDQLVVRRLPRQSNPGFAYASVIFDLCHARLDLDYQDDGRVCLLGGEVATESLRLWERFAKHGRLLADEILADESRAWRIQHGLIAPAAAR